MFPGDFAKGITIPLPIPACVRREWQINGYEGEGKDEDEDLTASVGYAFEWGQIIEDMCEPNPDDPPEERGFIGVCWHFLLTGLHQEFLDAGGNLGELSDLAMILFHPQPYNAKDVATRLRKAKQPKFVDFDEGNCISAFEIMVMRTRNVARARRWVADVFIPDVLPYLRTRLWEMNRAAASGEVPA